MIWDLIIYIHLLEQSSDFLILLLEGKCFKTYRPRVCEVGFSCRVASPLEPEFLPTQTLTNPPLRLSGCPLLCSVHKYHRIALFLQRSWWEFGRTSMTFLSSVCFVLAPRIRAGKAATPVLEFHKDEICKVEGMLEELGMWLQEDVKKMPEAEKTQLCKKEEFFWEEKNMLQQRELLLMQSGHHNMVQQIGQGNSSSGDVP